MSRCVSCSAVAARRRVFVLVVAALAAAALPQWSAAAQSDDPSLSPAADPETVFDDVEPVVVNDNGVWSWFEDERAVIAGCTLYAGSVADAPGAGGREGIEVAALDLASGEVDVQALNTSLVADDHNSPALFPAPAGHLVATSTGHDNDSLVRTSVRAPNDVLWAPRPSASVPGPVSYSNLLWLGDENGGQGRLYDFFRGQNRDTRFVVSNDQGATWSPGGALFNTLQTGGPYVKYWSNGEDRIDVLATDGHPNSPGFSSIYHGFISEGVVHRSDGTAVAPLGTPISVTQLTRVFEGDAQNEGWTADVALDEQGRPVAAFTVSTTRVPPDGTAEPTAPPEDIDHRYYEGRWDGSAWQVTEIARGGQELIPDDSAEDYTGTMAIDPNDTDRVVISTSVHPLNGSQLLSSADDRVHFELWEGVTDDGGQSWAWAPITENSSEDQLRPVIPAEGSGVQALLWLRGTYDHWRDYDLEVAAAIVGDPSGCPPPVLARRVGGDHRPLGGDFDGDGHGDVLWFAPGTAPDHVTLGRPGPEFVARPVRADGNQRVVSGDFDGDGLDDVVWHGPGSQPDEVWFGAGEGSFDEAPAAVGGTYTPLSGDFDGDGRHDIFWYAPGSAADFIWFGNADRTFTGTPRAISGTYRPVTGDFDGDGRHDIFWYAPGSATDFVWWGNANRSFATTRSAVSATYTPFTADFDGNGRHDIFWYAPGSAADFVWWGNANRTFASTAQPVNGTYRPVTGDFDASSTDDVLLYGPGAGSDQMLLGQANRTFTPSP